MSRKSKATHKWRMLHLQIITNFRKEKRIQFIIFKHNIKEHFCKRICDYHLQCSLSSTLSLIESRRKEKREREKKEKQEKEKERIKKREREKKVFCKQIVNKFIFIMFFLLRVPFPCSLLISNQSRVLVCCSKTCFES